VILVDTNIWIDHLGKPNAALSAILSASLTMVHPAIIGEIALGHLAQRSEFLALLSDQPSLERATDAEVLNLIETRRLYGLGIGFVDAHLLASLLLTPGAAIWTKDKRLLATADACDIPVFMP
jgi:predicted nucleic acid-binding protein